MSEPGTQEAPASRLPPPTELKINGNWYRLGRMSAQRQLHVMRRLAPFHAAILAGAGGGDVMPMCAVIARMPEDDFDYIFRHCLDTVTRKSGEGWAHVINDAGRVQFDDIEAVEQIELVRAVVRVFQEPFFKMLADVMQ